MDEKNENELAVRAQRFKTWQYFLIAVGAHIAVILVFSPQLLGREDTSPETLIQQARLLVEDESYEEALEMYGRVIAQKPEIPAVFRDAERELERARREMLEKARRRAEEAEKEKDDKKEEEKEEDDIFDGLPDL